MPEYKLDFAVNVGSAAPMRSLSDAVREVAERTKAGSGDLRVFQTMLEADAKAGISLTKSLEDIRRGTETVTPGVRNLASEFQKLNQVQAQTQAQSQKTAQAIEKNYTDASRNSIRELQNLSRTINGISGTGLPGGSAPITGLLGGAGTIGLISGVTAAVAGLSLGIFELVKSAGEGARDLANFSSRLGLTMEQAQKLSIAARITGVNIGSLEQSARLLGQALDDPTGAGKKQIEVLNRLGISTKQASGENKEMGQTLAEVLQRLSQIPNVAERVHESQLLLGRGSKELQPLIEDLPRLTKAADELAASLKGGTNAELLKANEAINKLDEAWDIFKKNVAAGIAPVTITVLTNLSQDLKPGPNRGPQGLAADSADPRASSRDPFFAGRSFAPTAEQTSALTGGITAALQDIHQGDELGKKIQEQYNKTKDGLQEEIEQQKRAADAARQNATATGAGTKYKLDQQKLMNEALAKEAQLRAQLKSQEQFTSQSERFRTDVLGQGFPTDPADILRQLRQFPKTYSALQSYGPYRSYFGQLQTATPGAAQQLGRNMLEHQFPGLAGGDYSKLYSPMGKQDREFQGDLERQERQARESIEQLKKASTDRIDDINRQQRDQTGVSESLLQLHTAQLSGQRSLFTQQRGLSPTGAAQLELEDQMKLISEAFAAKASPLTTAITKLQGVPGADDEQRDAIKRDIEQRQAQLEELQTQKLTQSTEALDKFKEAVADAGDKLKGEFGGFISGLVGAAREGHAGTYAQNYMLGQVDKIAGNLASSIYPPGLFSFPGQGTPENPTFLASLFKGAGFLGQAPSGQDSFSIFRRKPLAPIDLQQTIESGYAYDRNNLSDLLPGGATAGGKQDSAFTTLSAQTDLNTKATIDNTAVMAAVYEALGGDPTSLGISNLPAIPTLTGGTSSVALPFFGAAGAAGAAGAGTLLTSVLKSAGVNVAGVTTPSGTASISTPSSGLTSLFKAFSGGGSSANSPGSSTGVNQSDAWDLLTDSGLGAGPSYSYQTLPSGLILRTLNSPGGYGGSGTSVTSNVSYPGNLNSSDFTNLNSSDFTSLSSSDFSSLSSADFSSLNSSDFLNASSGTSYSALIGSDNGLAGYTGAGSGMPLTDAVSSVISYPTQSGSSMPNTVEANLFNPDATAGQEVGSGIATAGAVYTGVQGFQQMFKGGGQNALGGISKVTAAAASMDPDPTSQAVLATVAEMTGLVSALIGNPKQERQASINHELFNNQYIAPMAYTRTMDISGGYASMNDQGVVRGTDLSSIPIIQQGYPDPRHGVIVPPTLISPFGGGGPSTTVSVGNRGGTTTDTGAGGSNGGAPAVQINVSAIDGDSVASFFQNNAQAFGDGFVHALNTGGSDMLNRLRTL